ncbi:hypothetical protein [Streptomyces sp. NPDC097981]|uniref:hypothetical protein n=1 Tax=Streptomyces sp. NPDC097981 TaxID=3155428 RepID=UPI0033310742
MTKLTKPIAVICLCTAKDEPVVTRKAMCERVARDSGLHLAGVIHHDGSASLSRGASRARALDSQSRIGGVLAGYKVRNFVPIWT